MDSYKYIAILFGLPLIDDILERIEHFSVWFFWYEEPIKSHCYFNFTILEKADDTSFSVILYIKRKKKGKYEDGFFFFLKKIVWKRLQNSVPNLENSPIQPRFT